MVKNLGGGYENKVKYECATARKEDKSFEKIHNSFLGTIWCKLYRRAVMIEKHIRFEDIESEDELFNYSFMVHAATIRTIKYAGYYFIRHADSQGGRHCYLTEMNWIDKMLGVHTELARRWRMDVAAYKERLQAGFVRRFTLFLLKGYFSDSSVSRKERIKRWEEVLRHEYFRSIPLDKFKGRDKVIALIARLRLFYVLDPFLKAATK